MTIIFILLFFALSKPAADYYMKSKNRRKEKQREKARQAAAAAKIAENEIKRLQRIQKENQRKTEKAEKHKAQLLQALNDIPFYQIQLDRLYITVEDTRNQYKKACDNVNHDNALNRYGAVIKDKVVNQHITERDKALKKLITLENQIHALEKKKAAAELIVARE